MVVQKLASNFKSQLQSSFSFFEALCLRILRLAAMVEDQSVLMISVMNDAGVSGVAKQNLHEFAPSKSSRKYLSKFPACFTQCQDGFCSLKDVE